MLNFASLPDAARPGRVPNYNCGAPRGAGCGPSTRWTHAFRTQNGRVWRYWTPLSGPSARFCVELPNSTDPFTLRPRHWRTCMKCGISPRGVVWRRRVCILAKLIVGVLDGNVGPFRLLALRVRENRPTIRASRVPSCVYWASTLTWCAGILIGLAGGCGVLSGSGLTP